MEPVHTEEKIKRAALKEFAQHGFEGARVDRIALKAKVNKAMIYYHYKNKENLYESILKEVYQAIFPLVIEKIPGEKKPDEKIEIIIGEFINFIQELDQDFVRMMLRELSSGGKYFKKIMFPGVIVPLLNFIETLFSDGARTGIFKGVNPHYTFLQTFGSIIFFNALRTVLADTADGAVLFPENCFEEYKLNLLKILKTGILAR